MSGKVATMARNLLDERELGALLGRAAASLDSSSSQAISVGGIAPSGLGPGLFGSINSSSSSSGVSSGDGSSVGVGSSSSGSTNAVNGPSSSEHTYGVLNAPAPISHAVHHLGGGTLHSLGLGDGADPRASGTDGDGLPLLLNALGVPAAAWNPHDCDHVR